MIECILLGSRTIMITRKKRLIPTFYAPLPIFLLDAGIFAYYDRRGAETESRKSEGSLVSKYFLLANRVSIFVFLPVFRISFLLMRGKFGFGQTMLPFFKPKG